MRWTEQQLAEFTARRGAEGVTFTAVWDPPFAVPSDALQPVNIVLAGEPQGKGRPRATVRGGFARLYTPEKTRTYEGMIRTAAMDVMGDRPPIDQPVALVMRAVFGVPASWSDKKRTAALLGAVKPGKKPDYDNILKTWTDALNGVVFRDDALIVKVEFEKRYGMAPCVVATVRAA